jgi:site-specific DNA-methyltransferase (adenine-specific)
MLNTILCGRAEAVLKEIPDGYIDLTVTSPPYDNLRKYQGYVFDFETIARELYRVTKPGGVLVWVVGDKTEKGSETGNSFKQALFFMSTGFLLNDTMIFQKKNPLPTDKRNRYAQCFEYMFVFSKGMPKTFNPLVVPTTGKRKNYKSSWGRQNDKMLINTGAFHTVKAQKVRHNIFQYAISLNCATKDKIAFKHPAIFPEQLAEDHILSWSNPGDVVLDPMAGSGTTLKMAKLNGRNYIGIELSEMYVNEIIIPRLASEATALVAGE